MKQDVKMLSAYLDQALTRRARLRLEARLAREADLRRQLADLRMVRAQLRAAPRRSVPRSFVLTRDMAGVRPPVPPLAAWAQTFAVLAAFFLFVNAFWQAGIFSASQAPVMIVYRPSAPMNVEKEAPPYAFSVPTDEDTEQMTIQLGAAPTPLPQPVNVTHPFAPRDWVQPILLAVLVSGLLLSVWLRWRVRRRFYE